MKEEKQNKQQENEPQLREIIIKTDGNNVFIPKAEVAGNLEFIAILQSIINRLNIPPNS